MGMALMTTSAKVTIATMTMYLPTLRAAEYDSATECLTDADEDGYGQGWSCFVLELMDSYGDGWNGSLVIPQQQRLHSSHMEDGISEEEHLFGAGELQLDGLSPQLQL